MLKAALSHFVAERDRLVANLNNLLQNTVGIGEHVDVVGEVIDMVERLDKANSCVSLLTNMQAQPTEEDKDV